MNKKQSTVNRRTFLSSAAVAGVSGALGAGGCFTACSGGGNNENRFTPLRHASDVYAPELRPVRAIGMGSCLLFCFFIFHRLKTF